MVDLSDIVIPPAAANATPIITCTVEGVIEEQDLAALAFGSPVLAHPEALPQENEDPTDLKKIREKHHSVARMIAAGLNQRMVSQICGFSESYLSVLLNNPSMQELVELYRIQNGAAGQIIVEKLRTVGLKAVEKLEERMETDKLNNNELIQAAKLGLDRSDHGPTSRSHHIHENHHIDHAAVAEAMRKARSKDMGRVHSIDTTRAALPAPEVDDESAE